MWDGACGIHRDGKNKGRQQQMRQNSVAYGWCPDLLEVVRPLSFLTPAFFPHIGNQASKTSIIGSFEITKKV